MAGTLNSSSHLGIINTNNIDSNLKVRDFATLITRLMPNGQAPLFAMTAQFQQATATNTEHGYFAKTMVFPDFKLTATINNSQTTLTVDSTDLMIPGFIFQSDDTNENIIVNSVLSPTQVLVSRGIGGGATAITVTGANGYFRKVGTAYEEASLRPQAVSLAPVRISNLTQIFRNTYAISGTAEAVAVVAGDDTATENKRDAATFHATDIETALIFGKKSESTRNGNPFRTMDGIISIVSNLNYYPSSYATPNVFTAETAGTSSIDLEDMLDTVFNQVTDGTTSNMRWMFVGGQAKRVLNHIGRLNGEYKLVQGQTEWGLVFDTMHFARGSFKIIEHPLFNTNPKWNKMAVVVDPATFQIAYLGGRKTQDRKFNEKGQTVAQDNGIDATGGTLTTECTALIKNPPANAVVYNLTKALADVTV